MPVKHFIINPEKKSLAKETIETIRQDGEILLLDGDEKRFKRNEEILHEEETLKCIEGRVIIKIDDKSKDSHTFSDGTKIRLERRFNNFNSRETNPVNAFVIDSTYIPQGSQILIHPQAIHDTNRIFNYKDNNSDVRYYSINEEMCFAFHDGEDWRPLKTFDFALRIFKPYEGLISGIDPTLIKDCLFVTTGEYKNKVVRTLIACDYEIIFQGLNGQEQSLIRFRPNGDEKNKREPEAIAIDHTLTEKILNNKYLIGYSIKDAKSLCYFLKN